MNRPLYETKKDLSEELAIAKRLFAVWDVTQYYKLPLAYYTDFAICRKNKVVAVLEVKNRKHKPDTYPTLYFSLNKWLHGKRYKDEMNIEFLLGIGFSDGSIWHFKYDPSEKYEFDITWGGRNKKRDSQDQEPVIHIPVSKLKKLDEE
tara:strand:+ start:57 stop:500 length:444 start_codon:yes stop_codon:yes gene_type:complete